MELGNRSRRHGGSLRLALTVAAAIVAATASLAHGAQLQIDGDGVAHVQTGPDLQTTFTPRGQELTEVAQVERNFVLDPLSFIPQVMIQKPFTICGSPNATLVGVAPLRLVSVNSTLKVCRLMFDFAYEKDERRDPYDNEEGKVRVKGGDGLGIDELAGLLFNIMPDASVEFTDCVFNLTAKDFDNVLESVSKGGKDSNATSVGTVQKSPDGQSAVVQTMATPNSEMRNVTLLRSTRLRPARKPGHEVDPIDVVKIHDFDDFATLAAAAEETETPLELVMQKNFSLTKCVVDTFKTSDPDEPLIANRPITFKGRNRDIWFSMAADLSSKAFMKVEKQVRFEDVNVEFQTLSLSLFTDPPGAPGAALDADCTDPTMCLDNSTHADNAVRQSNTAFDFDNVNPGCRFVGKDVLVVFSCEFVQLVAQLQLVRRNNINGDSHLTTSINDFTEVADLDPIDSESFTYINFIGGGMCFQNATITCVVPKVEPSLVPGCLFSEENSAETIRSPVTAPFNRTIDPRDGANGSAPSPGGLPSQFKADDEDDGPLGRKGGLANAESSFGETKEEDSDDDDSLSIYMLVIIVVAALFGAGLLVIVSFSVHYYRRRHLTTPYSGVRSVGKKDRSASGGITECLRGDDDDGTQGVDYGEDAARGATPVALLQAIHTAGAGIEDNAVTIEQEIATGGYGVVYKGTWKGVPVAVKTVIFQDFADDRNKQRQRAVFEAAISSSVHHPNIVQTYAYMFKKLESAGLGPTEQTPGMDIHTGTAVGSIVDWKLYIVQEFCNSGSLRATLDNKLFLDMERRRVDLKAIVTVAAEAARGMLHLHNHNIVHGDLSTKNILLKAPQSGRAVAKIADFGLSVKMDPLQSHVSNQRAGTPFYMAPEVAQQGMLSKRADVFSFGVLMWELYHSKKCYKQDRVAGIVYQPMFSKFPVVCPMSYAMLCVACISPNPDDRPDFRFIEAVLTSLIEMVDRDEFEDIESVRAENMRITSTLGKVSGRQIMEVIAQQVNVPMDYVTGGGTGDDVVMKVKPSPEMSSNSSARITAVAAATTVSTGTFSMGQPTSSSIQQQKGMGASVDGCVHLNQALIMPLQCFVTVDMDKNPKPGKEELLNFAWNNSTQVGPSMMTPDFSVPGGKRVEEDDDVHDERRALSPAASDGSDHETFLTVNSDSEGLTLTGEFAAADDIESAMSSKNMYAASSTNSGADPPRSSGTGNLLGNLIGMFRGYPEPGVKGMVPSGPAPTSPATSNRNPPSSNASFSPFSVQYTPSAKTPGAKTSKARTPKAKTPNAKAAAAATTFSPVIMQGIPIYANPPNPSSDATFSTDFNPAIDGQEEEDGDIVLPVSQDLPRSRSSFEVEGLDKVFQQDEEQQHAGNESPGMGSVGFVHHARGANAAQHRPRGGSAGGGHYERKVLHEVDDQKHQQYQQQHVVHTPPAAAATMAPQSQKLCIVLPTGKGNVERMEMIQDPRSVEIDSFQDESASVSVSGMVTAQSRRPQGVGLPYNAGKIATYQNPLGDPNAQGVAWGTRMPVGDPQQNGAAIGVPGQLCMI